MENPEYSAVELGFGVHEGQKGEDLQGGNNGKPNLLKAIGVGLNYPDSGNSQWSLPLIKEGIQTSVDETRKVLEILNIEANGPTGLNKVNWIGPADKETEQITLKEPKVSDVLIQDT
ncbi:hypothetical protein CJ030_MR6G029208 [Morella rubra]|uniref:Uncharacterized protein n=1 Tax=Morella rubra TaxID=262757 RepID=A0A6A1VAY2_9ROSI|nr:hypothetical protein CJ030_MR6G029208 [Morella rubra]